MLEEMGITPDHTVREKKPTLRTVGLAVLATVRMQRMQVAWAENKKVHESLIKKLESMKRAQGQSTKKRIASGRFGFE